MTDTNEYITLEAMEFISDHIRENSPERKLQIRRYINETTFMPEVHIVIPYVLQHTIYDNDGFENIQPGRVVG